jgi:hypothetical protein
MRIQTKLSGGLLALLVGLALGVPCSQAAGILEILRYKGVITQEEYRQAIEEAQGKDKKVGDEAKSEAKAEATKQTKLSDWLSRTSFFADIRFRHEGFYNSEIDTNNPTRNRERIRLRLGARADIATNRVGPVNVLVWPDNSANLIGLDTQRHLFKT